MRKSDDDLARVGEHVGNIANVTLYVKELNKWTPEDLQHPYNNILLHFSFDNTQPSLSSTSNVVFPPYTKALLDDLARKRELPRGDEVQHTFLKATLGDHFIGFFDEVEGPGNTSEVRAYITAIKDCAPNVNIIKEKPSYFKESHFTVFLVDPVFRDLPLYDKGVSADPAMVIKQVDNKGDPRSYSPNSHFLLKTPYVPIIINETISPKNESDRCRMLLQAMVYVRVGNHLRTSRNLVILCFYLNAHFEAERYLVYQASTDNTNRVEIVHDRKFALSEPLQAFEFLFQLFNYKDTLPAVLAGFDKTQVNAAKTVSTIVRHSYRSISSRSESQKNGSRTKGKKRRGGRSHELYTIQEHKAALMLYGYKIVAPMKNHRHMAFARNRLHEEFVLKIVGRDELNFMNYLSSPQMLSDRRNHTVPFSHVTGIGYGKSIIAMPKLLPLDDVPLSSLQTAQCYNLLRQMVEGFTFLHGHGIAHLDLKSANIVMDTSLERLYIIDFGLAHKVNGPEDTVSGFRGTEQWVAPEVDDDGFPYSAIRADLWAVGELIQTVLILWHKGPTSNNGLKEVSTQLLSTDPLKRPMLNDILSKLDIIKGNPHI
ncbi:hypothetical protein APHAL10511_004089 [Amanita phalloides]|nr:hypothetical protein APHAL10511_004089 [Amanita phalloides]